MLRETRPTWLQSDLTRYVMACASILAVLLLKLNSDLLRDKPFLLFFGAIAFSAWFGGFGPGLAATGLAAIVGYQFFFLATSAQQQQNQILTLLLFVLEGAFISWLSGSLKGSQQRSEAIARQLMVSQAALRQSEGRFRHLSESGIIGIFATNGQGEILEANAAFSNILGYTRQELLAGHISWPSLTLPKYRPLDAAALEQLQGTGAIPTYEKQCQRKDGQVIWLLTGAALLDQGETDCPGANSICFVLDITQHKHIEEELMRSRDELEAILGGVADSITVQDATGKLVYANAAAARSLNYESPQALREADPEAVRNCFELRDEQGQLFPWAKLPARQVLRGEAAADQVIRYRLLATGEEHWFSVRATPIYDEQEQLQLAISIFHDITAHRQVEEEQKFLAEASALLAASLDYETTLASVARLAVSHLADICIIDVLEPDGSMRRLAVAHVDPAQEQALRELQEGYTPAPTLGQAHPVLKVLRTGRSDLMPELSDTFLAAITHDEEHLRLLRDEFGFKSSMVVPLAAHDRILGAISFIATTSGRRYNTADLARAEDLARRAALAVDNARLYGEAQEANRAKDVFLATLSHELRTPLTSMVGWIHLLRSGRLDETMTAQALEAIDRNTKAQAQLIEDLLEVSRAITGKLRLDVRAIDLNGVIASAVEIVAPGAITKDIALRVTLDPALGVMAGDPSRLQQVILNLLSNALKFTPTGGWIEVRLGHDTTTATISVQDSGMGIEAEFLSQVFDRFRQADSSMTRAYGGLGLGLAIVRHLVELHGGTVQAASAGPDQGATFTVQLPLRTERTGMGQEAIKI